MKNTKSIESNIQVLIIRFLEGRTTDSESVRLQEWVQSSPENLVLFNRFRHDWLLFADTKRYDANKALATFNARLARDRRRVRLVGWCKAVGYAAVVVIALWSGVHFSRMQRVESTEMYAEVIEPGSKKAILILGSDERLELGSGDDTLLADRLIKDHHNTLHYDGKNDGTVRMEFNRLITPRGGEYSVVLSDGTKVWLNAESELKYPVKFMGDKREVFLEGEAYFSVSKQQGKLFIVHTGKNQVTVLGTEFNLRNYANEEVAATLVKGAVVVADGHSNQRNLIPGQQAVFGEKGIRVSEVETIFYTAWKDGFFIYRDKPLEEILRELSRWYDFTYFYQNPGLSESVMTAKLKKFDSVDNIFEILAETGRFNFLRKGKTVTVVAR